MMLFTIGGPSTATWRSTASAMHFAATTWLRRRTQPRLCRVSVFDTINIIILINIIAEHFVQDETVNPEVT
jgi:hypothetical protein